MLLVEWLLLWEQSGLILAALFLLMILFLTTIANISESVLNKKNNMEEIKQARVLYFLTGVFIALKLTEQIEWSWWWVFSPLWIPAILLIVMLAIFTILE